MTRLWFNKQSPSAKLFLWITLLILLCSYKNGYSQTTPPTSYDCDYRNKDAAVDPPGDVVTDCPGGCLFTPVVGDDKTEKGCHCFNSIDDDGDGKIDAADPSCASYFGLSFIGEGSDCSITPPGSIKPFESLDDPIVSGQNTSDTQSKVAVGDLDGNGWPDVVTTSKWASTVKIVSTVGTSASKIPGNPAIGNSSFISGEIIAAYNVAAKDFPDCDGFNTKNVLFESEVLVADIDRDGVSEIFAVASNRTGNADSPPQSFFLVMLKVTGYGHNNGLSIPNSFNGGKAVCLGRNRPGIFGIADMDGDKLAEIYIRDRIFAAETGRLLASPSSKLMTGTGTADWDTNVNAASVAVDMKSAPADGNKMELVVGAQIYTIPSLTTRTGAAAPLALTLWRDMNNTAQVPAWDVTGEGTADKYFVKVTNDVIEYGVDTHGSTSVADVDKDGYVDVVLSGAVNATNGRTAIFYWNVQDGTVTGMLTPNSAALGLAAAHPDYNNYLNGWSWGTGRVNIGDANGDGKLDFSFVAGNQLFCMTTDATNKLETVWTQNQLALPSTAGVATRQFGYRSINDSRSGVLAVTIYDFDNDGKPEMVYRDSREVVIVDGLTGNLEWSDICRSHTYTEGPIIADVNGDGDTDIACSCVRTDAIPGASDGIQQQALGEVRLWSSDGLWLPTRKVWNQPGYFVVNINDDLTLPFPQLDIAAVFGNAPCPNGIPGPNTPYNVFLNQVPFLSANGCPVFPAPDLEFLGFDPTDPRLDPTDPAYDPSALPTVYVDPNICGNVDLKVALNINNTGDLPISATIPVSFFRGSPYDPANPYRSTGPTDPDSVLLYSTTIQLSNLQVGDTLSIGNVLNPDGTIKHTGDLPFIQFDGPGSAFELYVVLYNDGTVIPIDTASSGPSGQVPSGAECDITNNYWPIMVNPKPFTVNIDSLDNVKCLPTSPNSGELISHISVGADTVIDLSPYDFKWYMADQVTPVSTAMPTVVDTDYNLVGLPAGDYYLTITNTEKGCASSPILGQVVDGLLAIPGDTVILVSDQTKCSPPNGSLKAEVIGADIANYEFRWEDSGAPIGVTGQILSGVKAGTYTVIIRETSSGCETDADGIIGDLTQEPDVTASATDVVNCINPSSGSVTATAFFNGAPQDSVGYKFDWYQFNKSTGTRGSILPGSTGKPTIKGLPIGYYEVVITQLATGCKESNAGPDTVEVEDMTFLPEARLTRLAPQTSCDPLLPNGRLQADAYVNGVLQPPGNYTFTWYVGQSTVVPHTGGTSGINGQIGENLKGGGQSYTVKVTNANQCSGFADTTVAEIIKYPIVTLGTTPNSVCDVGVGFTGSVSVATLDFNSSPVTLPNANYTLKWYNGPLVAPAKERLADLNKSSLTQVDSGFYTLVVENTLLHCPSVAYVKQVLSIKALPLIKADADSSTNCMPLVAGNGKVKVTRVDNAVPNTALYDITWHVGIDQTGAAAGALDQVLVSGIQGSSPNNFYTVLVRNQLSGCENTKTVEVTDAKVIPVITLAAQDNSICDPALTTAVGDTYNGKVTATVTPATFSGVLTDYTFAFGAGMVAGVPLASPNHNQYTQLNGGPTAYSATTTNVSTGCVSLPVTIPVTNLQDFPNLTTSFTASTNCTPALVNGKARVVYVENTPLPGLPATTVGYTYAWTGPAAFSVVGNPTNDDIELQNVQGGGVGFDYTVVVTNTNNGCQATTAVNVPDAKALPELTLTPQDNTICDPTKVTIGTAAFDGQVSAVVDPVGIYVGNVPGDFTFTWNTGLTGVGQNVLPNKDVGSYTVTALHTSTGCLSTSYNAQVGDGRVLPALTMGQLPAQYCAGGAPDGTAQLLNVVPGGKNYNLKWFDGNSTAGTAGPTSLNTTATTSNYPNVQGGANGVGLFEYTMEVTILQTGCVHTETVGVDNISQVPAVTLKVPVDNTNCTAPFNGLAELNTLNYRGNPIASPYTGFTFAWSAGGTVGPAPGETYINLPAGNYTLTVTNTDDNCISNPVPATIGDNLFIPVIDVVDVVQTSCNPATPNGSLTATIDQTTLPGVPGVTAGYTFNWVDDVTTLPIGAGSNAISSLKGNQFYTISVERTATRCTHAQQIFLDENLVIPTVAVAVTDLTVCAPLNGKLVATPSPGAIGDYTYFWYDGNDALDEDAVVAVNNTGLVGVVTTNTYDQLIPGQYTIVVVNNTTECKSQQLIKTIVNNSPPINPVIANTIIPTSCALSNGEMQASVQTLNTTFTGLAATDVLTTGVAHGLAVNDKVILSRNGGSALPVPLVESTIYFVKTTPTATTLTLSATAGGAIINLTVDGNGFFGNYGLTAGYTFNWYFSAPQGTDPLQPINYFTNPPDFAALVPPAVNVGTTYSLLPTGLYSMEVTDNATGCKTYITHTLPFIGAHAVIHISKTNTTVCPPTPDNGSVTVRIEDPVPPPGGTLEYTIALKQGVTTVAGPFTDQVQLADITVSSALSVGTYIVEVTQEYGTGCKLSQDVTIGSDARDPVITLAGSITSNSACGVANADGRIDLNVDKAPDDITIAAAVYDVAMTPPIATSGFDLNNVAAGNHSALNLPPDTYTFTALETTTGCTSSKAFTVLDNPVVSQFVGGNLLITDAEYCNALLEQSAKVIVNQLDIVGGGAEVLADYEFKWTNIATSTTVFTLLGNAAAIAGGDEFINQVPAAANGTVAPGTVWKGSYTVAAEKKFDASTTGGIGCTSAPFNIVIASNFITPQIVLTPTGDTSCDPTFFAGSIEVDVTTASGPGLVSTYGYAWTPTGAAGQPANSVGNSGTNNIFTSINDGSYSLTATNTITGCPATLGTSLIKEPPPVFTLSATATDLTNCDPTLFDGKIDNIQVFIDGAGGTETDFDYTWYKTDLTGVPVIDGPTVAIDDQLTLTTYPGISLGTYFVKAIRKAGGPGVGCESSAINRVISDDRKYPQVALTQIENTACDGNFDGKITVTATTAGAPGVGYNFVWTSDPDGVGALFTAANSATNNTASPFSTKNTDLIGPGAYAITVTNFANKCATNGNIVLQTNSVPMEIVSVTSTNVDVCLPMPVNGSGTVTDVKIGVTPGQTLLFDYTWDNESTMALPNLLTNSPALTLGGLDIGTYYVRARRLGVPSPATPGVTGSGCFTPPIPFDVLNKRITPSVSLSMTANTSCVGAGVSFDGQITVTATTSSGPGAAGGVGYNFVWTSDPDGAGALYGAANPPNNTASPYSTQPTDLIGPGAYTIDVSNFATGCTSPGSITVLSNPVPIIVTSATGIDQMICAADGSILVVDVVVGGTPDLNHNNFDFSWYRDTPTPGTEIVPVANGNDLLNATDAFTAPMIMEGGSYYVKVKRLPLIGPGANCESAPFRVNIQDVHLNPIPQLVAFANSTCNLAFNGSIQVTVTETGFGAGSLYTYNWDEATNPTNIETIFGSPATGVTGNNGDGVGADDNPTGLNTGPYSVSVINETTFCKTPAAVTIQYDPVVSKPNVIDVDTNLPFDCLGSGGDAAITAISIGGAAAITDSRLDTDFYYDWYDKVADAFAVPAIIPGTLPSNAKSISPLAHGTYWVTVRDLLTDCKSDPREIFIDSVNVVHPEVVIQQTALQLSCDVTIGTASLNALADGQDDTNLDYAFNWFNNLGGVPPVYTANIDSIGDLKSGQYSVRVLRNSTGCDAIAFFIIPDLDPTFLPTLALSGDEQSSCLVDNGSVVVRILPFPPADNGLTYEDTFKDPITGLPVYNFEVDLYTGNQLGSGLGNDPAPIPPNKNNIPRLPFSPDPGSFISDTLGIGTYTIRLRDANTGCVIVDTTSISNSRRDPVPVIVVENPLTNCDSRLNGQLSATASGQPVGDYEFYWWSVTNPPPAGDTLSINNKLIGQDQGNYQVKIVNKVSGCDAIATEIIPAVQQTIFAPTIELLKSQIICWENFYPADPSARPTGSLSASVRDTVLGYRFDWYTGQYNHDGIIGVTPDTIGLKFLHLTGKFGSDPGVYTVSAVDLVTGCWAVSSLVVPDERVIPIGKVSTTPSYCSDAALPTGYAIIDLTNDEPLSLKDVSWFDDRTNASVGGGTQIFNIPPGIYRAEFLTTHFCYGEAVGEVLTEIRPYNLVSSNGDNQNDTWVIDCISNYTVAGGAKQDNNIKIFNRYGVLIYEINGYNNADKVFRGIGENGLYSFGNDLPDGTYFYIIDKRNGAKPVTGFLELVR